MEAARGTVARMSVPPDGYRPTRNADDAARIYCVRPQTKEYPGT